MKVVFIVAYVFVRLIDFIGWTSPRRTFRKEIVSESKGLEKHVLHLAIQMTENLGATSSI